MGASKSSLGSHLPALVSKSLIRLDYPIISMAKFTLFLVHGIGIHQDPSWANETIDMLEVAWQRDVSINGDSLKFSDHIDVIPISYDEVFEDYLDDFSDLSKAVFTDALDLGADEKQQLSNTLAEHKVNDRHFVWSYLVDVILYKMPLVREQVNALVAKQLYQRISQGSTSDNFGVIAHSLGTRVINDTLQRIRTEEASQGNFYQQGYKLKFLIQISDVTDLFGLPLHKDKYPPRNVYPRGTFDYFRTITNRFDPIARMIPTRLDHWPEGRDSEKYLGRHIYKDILVEHVHETNVHGLTHYMLHPEVTDEIFELCGFGRYLTASEARRQEFPSVGPKVQPGLRTALSTLLTDAVALADNSWQTYVNLVIKVSDFSSDNQEIIS
jgi:hypothetical protein